MNEIVFKVAREPSSLVDTQREAFFARSYDSPRQL